MTERRNILPQDLARSDETIHCVMTKQEREIMLKALMTYHTVTQKRVTGKSSTRLELNLPDGTRLLIECRPGEEVDVTHIDADEILNCFTSPLKTTTPD